MEHDPIRGWIPRLLALACAQALGACVLAPAGLDAERDALARDGAAWHAPREDRALPPLSTPTTPRELLQHAFLANGELEAAWQDWRAALARVTQAATWPSTDVELGFEYMFSNERMTAWDRTSLGVGFMPDTMLELPGKTRLMGQVALAEARAAGERFRAAKFALQRDFVEQYASLARRADDLELREQDLGLLRSAAAAAERAAALGDGSTGLVRLRIEAASAENEIQAARSELAQSLSRFRALVRVDPDVEIPTRDSAPLLRDPGRADDELLALAAARDPELAELAHSTTGRADALELARAKWWPNVSPRAGLTGSISRFVGASFSVPAAVPRIRAAIEEARAELDRAEALSAQKSADVAAGLTADLLALRESERAGEFLERTLLPLAQQLSTFAESAYTGGTLGQMEWIEALRTVIEARRALLGVREAREVSLARVQAWLGVDLETLARREEVSDAR